MNGWVALVAIAGFSIGEITASPRKAEYLASLAPKGREGLYLGYVNATQAIGWSIGSVLAGRLYETGGDKVVLARKMLVDRFGEDAQLVADMAKTSVVPHLQQVLNMDAAATTSLLWDTYSPQSMWTLFALIGATSMVALVVYGFLVKRIGAERDWIFGIIAVLYAWGIYDERAVTTFPKYAVLFATGLGVYALIRKLGPQWIPQGARESG